MNLYVITRDDCDGQQPCPAPHDEAAGFVVAARDEKWARWLAADNPGDEGAHFWMDPRKSICHLVGTAVEGQAEGILMRDFHAG